MKKELIAELLQKAEDFTAELTRHNVTEKDLKSKRQVKIEHDRNNRAIRKMLRKRGVRPELLPPASEFCYFCL